MAAVDAPPDTQPASMSIPGTLVGVLLFPARTFEGMREALRGHWWVVAVLALIGLALTTVATVPIQARTTQMALAAQQEAFASAPPEQAAQAAQMQSIMTSQVTLAGISLAGGIISLFVGYLIRAALLFALGLVFGGRATFRQVFRMAVWTTLPGVIRGYVAAAVMLTTGRLAAPGLSYALSEAEAAMPSNGVLVALLSSLDVYWLWSLILVAVGTAATYRISRGKGALIAVIHWLIGLGFTLGLAAIGQALASAFGPMG